MNNYRIVEILPIHVEVSGFPLPRNANVSEESFLDSLMSDDIISCLLFCSKSLWVSGFLGTGTDR
jgi:hypothetical protein